MAGANRDEEMLPSADAPSHIFAVGDCVLSIMLEMFLLFPLHFTFQLTRYTAGDLSSRKE